MLVEMLITGAAGAGAGGGGGGAADAPPPPPPIIIIITIIIIGSIPWFLLDARSLMELVICVIMVVSWSFDELAREVTRDAPPETCARSFEAMELNRFLEGMVGSFVVTSRYRAAAMPWQAGTRTTRCRDLARQIAPAPRVPEVTSCSRQKAATRPDHGQR
jgi:hypothetical protein